MFLTKKRKIYAYLKYGVGVNFLQEDWSPVKQHKFWSHLYVTGRRDENYM